MREVSCMIYKLHMRRSKLFNMALPFGDISGNVTDAKISLSACFNSHKPVAGAEEIQLESASSWEKNPSLS